MARLHIERKASDNKYLHRDFFESGDIGIIYVGENFGDAGVKEYLTQYAQSFYKLLVQKVLSNGLVELKKYFEEVYEKEEWSKYLHTNFDDDQLTICVDKCPAVTYMKSIGHTPSKWYRETVYTVYRVLADMCQLDFIVEYYDEEDGKMKIIFIRRK